MPEPVEPDPQPEGGNGEPATDVPPVYVIDPATQAIFDALFAGQTGDGGSSGGGGGAPVDPTIGAAASFYFQLWGRRPPDGYVENKIKSGFDLFDFIAEQLARPGAAKQTFFRDRYAQYAGALARTMGTRS